MGEVNTPFPKLKLTVTNVFGECYHGYKIGDELILEDFTHPPKFFCLGLAHVLFPVIYALSFGACFPFRDNQRSLLVTCPDGGKLEFKAEILDGLGKVQQIPKDHNFSRLAVNEQGGIPPSTERAAGKGPNPKKMTIEVVKAKGKCAYNYKVGDKWDTEGLKCIPGFCGAAFHCAFPALFALNFGAKFSFMENPDSIDTVTCPDGGNIVFKVSRIEE
ncbi:MAG: TIGR04076 family protein [Candidatus Omnitrophota bacterium]